jgi:hypothetical protein
MGVDHVDFSSHDIEFGDLEQVIEETVPRTEDPGIRQGAIHRRTGLP